MTGNKMQAVIQKLNGKRAKAIAAMLEHATLQAAADSIGVKPSTLWRWEHEPNFAEALKEAKQLVVQQALNRLQGATGSAVDALVEVLNSPNTPANARINAAKAAIDLILRAVENESIASRLSAIEEQINALNLGAH